MHIEYAVRSYITSRIWERSGPTEAELCRTSIVINLPNGEVIGGVVLVVGDSESRHHGVARGIVFTHRLVACGFTLLSFFISIFNGLG